MCVSYMHCRDIKAAVGMWCLPPKSIVQHKHSPLNINVQSWAKNLSLFNLFISWIRSDMIMIDDALDWLMSRLCKALIEIKPWVRDLHISCPVHSMIVSPPNLPILLYLDAWLFHASGVWKFKQIIIQARNGHTMQVH